MDYDSFDEIPPGECEGCSLSVDADILKNGLCPECLLDLQEQENLEDARKAFDSIMNQVILAKLECFALGVLESAYRRIANEEQLLRIVDIIKLRMSKQGE
jgi:hypothetical protein